MKAAVLRAPGGLDRIEVHDIPDSGPPGPGQIRIALHASSINYHDLLVATGGLPTVDGRVLMSDGAGVIVEAMTPALMVAVTEEPGLEAVAAEATTRLQAAIDALV